MVDRYEKWTKENWISALQDKNEKDNADYYLQQFPDFFLQKFNAKEIYEILLYSKRPSTIQRYILRIVQDEEYYLFLEENKNQKKLNKYIEKEITDIMFTNAWMLESGKGSLIHNTILYGLEDKWVIKHIDEILKIDSNFAYETFIKEAVNNPFLFAYLECLSPRLLEKVLPYDRVFSFVKQLKEHGYEKIIKENEDILLARLTGVNRFTLEIGNLLPAIKAIVRELLQESQIKMEDIEYIGKGSCSTVYKIGDFVFKSSIEKINKKIPDHPRILKPYLRKEIMEDQFLEVYKYTKPATFLTQEYVYAIYKEFREAGMIWFDPKNTNLGILLEDNITHLQGKKVHIKNESVGFLGEDGKETPLKTGNIVLLDVDAVVYKEDFNEAYYESLGINLEYYRKMEYRYQNEKRRNASR